MTSGMQSTTTTLQHPPIPGKASFIERLALGVFFNILQAIVTNSDKQAEFKEYFEPVRDALNEAYPTGE